jgi:hypothetical protein
VRFVALTDATNANRCALAMDRGAQPDTGGGPSRKPRVWRRRQSPRAGRYRRETAQREFPKAKGLTTSPIGTPVLSRGRKASSKSSKGRTERSRGTGKGILDDRRTG